MDFIYAFIYIDKNCHKNMRACAKLYIFHLQCSIAGGWWIYVHANFLPNGFYFNYFAFKLFICKIMQSTLKLNLN